MPEPQKQRRRGHEGEPARGIAFEGIRNRITDGVVSILLNRMRRSRRDMWEQVVFTVKKYEDLSRASIIGLAHITDEIFHRIPILDAPLLAEWRHEMLEQVPESFVRYARGIAIEVPADFTLDESAIGALFHDALAWVRDTVGEWLGDVSKFLLAFLPWIEQLHRVRDDHLRSLSADDSEKFQRWADWVVTLHGEDLEVYQKCMRALSNPALRDQVLALEEKQRIVFLRVFQGKGIGDHVSDAVNGVGRTVTPLLTTYSVERRAKNAALDRRSDELMRNLGWRR